MEQGITEFSIQAIGFAISAGFFSVASPCVLPLLPIIVAGPNKEDKLRPILLIIGLTITFIGYQLLSSLFASSFPNKRNFEIVGAIIILIFGLLSILNINIFKKITFFNRFNHTGSGKFSGLLVGLTLGLVWLPCIGLVLGSLITLTLTVSFTEGIILMLFYSLGFAIPLLSAAYASFFFKKLDFLKKNPTIVNIVSGILMISFSIYLLTKGAF